MQMNGLLPSVVDDPRLRGGECPGSGGGVESPTFKTNQRVFTAISNACRRFRP